MVEDFLKILLLAGVSYLFYLGFTTNGLFSVANIRSLIQGPSSVRREEERLREAIATFAQFRNLAQSEEQRMQKSFTKLGRYYKRVASDVGYPVKLQRLSKANEANSKVAERIAHLAISQHNLNITFTPASGNELSKVREAFKHYVRDWSTEGAKERKVIFGPILAALSEILQESGLSSANELDVLVPGSGLGRLAWETHEMGFRTTAVELSPFMNIAFNFLLSPDHTAKPFQHKIQPHAHWFSHQRSNEALFRTVAFPDVLPRLSETFLILADDFMRLQQSTRNLSDGLTKSGYDVVVTLFFIDTSLNIIATLEQIHRLLRPGGRWINLGPLLWTGGFQSSLELSLEEVLRSVDLIGFDIDEKTRRSIDCEYTADGAAMMRWIYEAEFWVAQKRS
ncbi:N2227-domain-containing protein [Schizopora paradoxa]|uniref:N2227-domain-containing protein n=1 Tax=Schizopora paradoxa TaxID=27342 RepID=A0A0H2RCX1_9AGAM|nr:N2227-domain-containing protein [Schizopora paradoxa]